MAVNGQVFDTLFTRGNNYILVERLDTLKQLEQTNMKVDSLLIDLKSIMTKLDIDTTKPEKK